MLYLQNTGSLSSHLGFVVPLPMLSSAKKLSHKHDFAPAGQGVASTKLHEMTTKVQTWSAKVTGQQWLFKSVHAEWVTTRLAFTVQLSSGNNTTHFTEKGGCIQAFVHEEDALQNKLIIRQKGGKKKKEKEWSRLAQRAACIQCVYTVSIYTHERYITISTMYRSHLTIKRVGSVQWESVHFFPYKL